MNEVSHTGHRKRHSKDSCHGSAELLGRVLKGSPVLKLALISALNET
jgi:hypothetical protein